MLRAKALGIAGISIVAAACGTTSTAATTTSAAPPAVVNTILTSKTAQMIGSGQNATFTITALSSTGAPVASAPVSFYLGTMVPLSGVGVKTWIQSGTSAAAPYVLSADTTTNSNGKATLVLKGQPNDTMEMIGVSVGDLSTYSATKGAIGSMDAWWTTAGTTPTAPIGDYVTVSPFATKTSASTQNLSILVSSPQGPVSGAVVTVTPKTATTTGMGASSSSSSGMGGSSSTTMATSASSTPAPMSYTTSANGTISTSVISKSTTPFRIVVTQGAGSTSRIAGGMNALILN